jgi:hypothetical protein
MRYTPLSVASRDVYWHSTFCSTKKGQLFAWMIFAQVSSRESYSTEGYANNFSTIIHTEALIDGTARLNEAERTRFK